MSTRNQNTIRWGTIKETAEASGLAVFCIRQMVKNNTLPSVVVKAGRKTLINIDLLLENLSKTN